MENGRGVFFVSVVLSILVLMPLVSAFYLPPVRSGIETAITSLIDIFEPILRALFGGLDWSGAVLFEKLLLFVLLLSVIFVVTGRIPLFEDQPAVRWIVSIVIPLIGVRFIDVSSIMGVFTQYGVLTIVLTSVIPFIIYFYFLYEVAGMHGILRKLGWLIFCGIYLGLWGTTMSSSASAVYFWTFVGGLVCLFGDNIINKRLEVIERVKGENARQNNELAEINKQIRNIEEGIRERRFPNERLALSELKRLQKHYNRVQRRF